LAFPQKGSFVVPEFHLFVRTGSVLMPLFDQPQFQDLAQARAWAAERRNRRPDLFLNGAVAVVREYRRDGSFEQYELA
jgi:hypothetical protein